MGDLEQSNEELQRIGHTLPLNQPIQSFTSEDEHSVWYEIQVVFIIYLQIMTDGKC